MAVALDAKMAAGNSSDGLNQETNDGTTCSSTGITVGSGASLLVVVIFVQKGVGGDPGTVSGTWAGNALTVGPSANNNQGRATILWRVNPTAGAQTLACSWANTSDAYMSAASFTGVDTTTPVVLADNVSGTSGTTVTVTSDTSGATVAVWGTNGSTPTVNFTKIFAEAPLDPGAGASYALGGTSNGHTFTGAGGSAPSWAGIHINAAAGGAAAAGHGPHLGFQRNRHIIALGR